CCTEVNSCSSELRDCWICVSRGVGTRGSLLQTGQGYVVAVDVLYKFKDFKRDNCSVDSRTNPPWSDKKSLVARISCFVSSRRSASAFCSLRIRSIVSPKSGTYVVPCAAICEAEFSRAIAARDRLVQSYPR